MSCSSSSSSSSIEIVRSAGGIIVRGDGEEARVLLVRRPPPRSDWVLPKGHVESGETAEIAALREVEEEACVRCEIVEKLKTMSYSVGRRWKLVELWLMRPVLEMPFVADEMVERGWFPSAEAWTMLSREHEREAVRRALGVP